LCDGCKCNISTSVKIITDSNDFCPSCFAKTKPFPISFRVISCLDILLFDDDWRAI
jgi:hypothetical protein